MALAPLRQFDLKTVLVSTMQAVSGAGYPGVPSLDILGNVVPFIGGEEEKMESETLKILGTHGGRVAARRRHQRAHQSRRRRRRPHHDGVGGSRREAVDGRHHRRAQRLPRPPAGTRAAERAESAVIVMTEPNRPQPRLDADRGDGMAVTVGRVRPCKATHAKFVALGHNTVRGAAGAAILNAELMAAEGFFD